MARSYSSRRSSSSPATGRTSPRRSSSPDWWPTTAGLGLAAERSRFVVPATARAVAHLAAALTAPVGIAAAAVTGATWPVCVLSGGVLAAVVCDVQARRWRAPLLDGAALIAAGLAIVGLAALVPVPVACWRWSRPAGCS